MLSLKHLIRAQKMQDDYGSTCLDRNPLPPRRPRKNHSAQVRDTTPDHVKRWLYRGEKPAYAGRPKPVAHIPEELAMQIEYGY